MNPTIAFILELLISKKPWASLLSTWEQNMNIPESVFLKAFFFIMLPILKEEQVSWQEGTSWWDGNCSWVLALASTLISHVNIFSFLNVRNRIQRRNIGNLYNQVVIMLCLVVRLWMSLWFDSDFFFNFYFFSKFYVLGMHCFSIYCPFQVQYLFACKNQEEKKKGDNFQLQLAHRVTRITWNSA